MGIICAIGGGDFKGRAIKEFDEIIVSKSQKREPKVLLIPTASKDNVDYCDCFRGIYENEFNAKVEVLWEREFSNANALIDWADIIYISGGNTHELIRKLCQHGIDKQLLAAFRKGKVLAGLSAGAICWFKQAYTDANTYRYKDTIYNFEIIEGLNFYPYACCPHFNVEGREYYIDEINIPGFALEDNTMLVLEDDSYEVHTVLHSSIYFVNQHSIKEVVGKGRITDI